MRGDSNERLTILSEAEKTALYGIPGFDDFQRVEFFAMTEAERSLGLQRRGRSIACCKLATSKPSRHFSSSPWTACRQRMSRSCCNGISPGKR